MTAAPSIGDRVIAQELQIQRLLAEASLVGGIFSMGYHECLVLTNDLWKRAAGGVPQHCFLVASAFEKGEAPTQEDEELILLRVTGPGQLPAETELLEVRAEAMREMVTRMGAEASASEPAILDVLTRNEIQFSALKGKVIGTFYDEVIGGQKVLRFASDLDNFYSVSRYKVYKPLGDSLEIIASYPATAAAFPDVAGELPKPWVRLGLLRYSSSNRRQRTASETTSVPVRVDISDFVAMKTAVFGMTRLGKSNTMKTIATAVAKYSGETNVRIGQLFFDPAGEYANVNPQDQTALSQIGSKFVTIFRYGASEGEEGVKPLSTNFFSPETIGVTWAIVRAFLSAHDAIYVQSFLSADVVGPEELEEETQSAYRRAERRRAALFATFLKAGFSPPPQFAARFQVNAKVLEAVNALLSDGEEDFASGYQGYVTLGKDDLVRFWDHLSELEQTGDLKKVDKEWVDAGLEAILKVYSGSVGAGWRLLLPLLPFHSPNKIEDYAAEILSDLKEGKIVIVDLSAGTETLLQFCSERIVNHILKDAGEQFSSGVDKLARIQIFVEEAHKLFGADRMKKPEEADPWVRLAKEAAKYKIGLVYATQEVTSVDPLILSNTSNWVVAHLNNTGEVKQLSKYYEFEDFADQVLRAEDVGFVRIKTRSGRYIVPLQVDLFGKERVVEAREALEAGFKQVLPLES